MALPSNLRSYLEAVRERVERRCILRALAELGTVAKAARALGMNRQHCHKRMTDLGILSPRAQRKAERSRLEEAAKRRVGPTQRSYALPPGADAPNTARAARR